jgi:hypothetical protein
MRQLGPTGLALIVLCISMAGGAGCSILLDSSANPYKCQNDDDCGRFPSAVCDDIKKECVPRLPIVDSGTVDTGAGGTSGLTCELSFDNQARINLMGPDGGLRPLPPVDGGE